MPTKKPTHFTLGHGRYMLESNVVSSPKHSLEYLREGLGLVGAFDLREIARMDAQRKRQRGLFISQVL